MSDDIQPYNSDANGNPIRNIYKFPDSDSMLVTRLRRVERTVPYQRSGVNVVTTANAQGVATDVINNNGTVNIASSGVQKIGAMSPNGVTGQFAAVTTGTTITWYWDGTNGSTPLVIHRADGTSFAVPRGSITVSGLANSTTYYFLPFWSTTGGCQPGWVIGTHGTPQIAFVLADTTDPNSAQYYLAQQVQQNREQLANGFMTQATTSGGTGGGGAGGGGKPGNCVMTGTAIEPIGDFGELTEGIYEQSEWIRMTTFNGCDLSCTPDHPVYACDPVAVAEMAGAMLHSIDEENLSRFRIEAKDVQVGDFLITKNGPSEVTDHYPFIRACNKRSTHMTRGHLFWANDILSHNKAIGT